MIFHRRAVSLMAIVGGSSLLVSVAAADASNHSIVYGGSKQKQKQKQQSATRRRAKRTKASASDNLIDGRADDGIGAAPTTDTVGDGSSKSAKSSKNTQTATTTQQDDPLNFAGGDDAAAATTTVIVGPDAAEPAPTAPTATPTDAPTSAPTQIVTVENKIYDEDVLVLPLGVNRDDTDGTETVVSTNEKEEEAELKAIDKWNFYMDHVPEDGPGQEPRGQEGGEAEEVDGGLKATDQFSFYTEHSDKEGGAEGIATRGGDDDDDDDNDNDRGGSNDEDAQPGGNSTTIVLKPIDDAQFYEDFVPDGGVGLDSDDQEGEQEEEDDDEGEDEDEVETDVALRTIAMDPASVATTPTVSPATASPTMKPTNAPIVPPPPLPTNAPIVPPPTTNVPEAGCVMQNEVEVCIKYYADMSCDMQVDGMTCSCCGYNSEGFIYTFDCTNIGNDWGAMGSKCLEEDALSVPSPEFGDDNEADVDADFISLAWAGGDEISPDSISSLGIRQRRGRRRALAARRRAAATKKRREAMV